MILHKADSRKREQRNKRKRPIAATIEGCVECAKAKRSQLFFRLIYCLSSKCMSAWYFVLLLFSLQFIEARLRILWATFVCTVWTRYMLIGLGRCEISSIVFATLALGSKWIFYILLREWTVVNSHCGSLYIHWIGIGFGMSVRLNASCILWKRFSLNERVSERDINLCDGTSRIAPAAELWIYHSKHFDSHVRTFTYYLCSMISYTLCWMVYGFVFFLFKLRFLRLATCPCHWIETSLTESPSSFLYDMIKCAKINRI